MGFQKLPLTGLDDINHRRRARETLNGVLDHSFDDSKAQTSQEKLKGKTPVNKAYPVGDIRRWGAVSGEDCWKAIQDSLDTAGVAMIPENFTALISQTIDIVVAGLELYGNSRLTSVIQPVDGFSAQSLVANTFQGPGPGSGSSYGHSIHDLFFRCEAPNLAILNVIGVDLASVNNTCVSRCRFTGTYDPVFANMLATGVRFAAPLNAAAYANTVHDCDFTYLGYGVLVADGGNHNIVRGGEFTVCNYGIHAAPVSATDCVYVDGPRFEGCDISIYEGSKQATYLRCRFESSNTADIKFNANSDDCTILSGHTASSPSPFLVDMNLATGLHIFAPDLYGMYSNGNSASRPNELIGPNVLAPLNDTGTSVNPPGIGGVCAYFRNGVPVLENNAGLFARNAAGTGGVEAIRINASDRVEIDPAGTAGIRLGGALTALGGGAAATLGTIGGAGPGTAAQNTWKLLYDNTGAAFWVPVWK